MKILNVAMARLVMALLLALTPMAAAQAQPDGWTEALRRLSATSTAYFEISKESDAVIETITSHLDAAAAHATAKMPAAEVQRWNDSWTADARSKITALKTRITNAPRYSSEDVRILIGDGRGLEFANALNETPVALAKLMDLLGQTVEQASLIAPRMAASDPEAELEMGLQLLNMGSAAIEVENVALTSQMTGLSPSHPQYALFTSARSLNLALVDLIEAIVRVGKGEPSNRKAFAAAMKAHLAEAEKAARQIPRNASQMSRQLQEAAVTPQLQEVSTKVQSAFASFDESAKIELQLVKLLSGIADQVARSDDAILDAAVALEKVDPLIKRRTVLMGDRAKALAE